MGSIAIITGANLGLGLHLAKFLYRSAKFTHLILACRNEIAGSRSAESIKRMERTVNTSVECLQLDLTSHSSIRSFVKQLADRCPAGALRLLVNNAGIMHHPSGVTAEEVEIHFATNHLGHFLLTNLLLDKMADNGRILNITSGYYEKCSRLPTIEDLTGQSAATGTGVTPTDCYAWSKLANCLHVVALSKRLKENGSHVKAMAVRPGFVRGTQLGRHTNWFLRFLAAPLIWMVAKNLDEGIRTAAYCALSEDEGALVSGKLYYNEGIEEYAPNGLVNEENAELMWILSQQLLLADKRTDTEV